MKGARNGCEGRRGTIRPSDPATLPRCEACVYKISNTENLISVLVNQISYMYKSFSFLHDPITLVENNALGSIKKDSLLAPPLDGSGKNLALHITSLLNKLLG